MNSAWKILAPIDLSRPAGEDVRYAGCIASALRTNLHLLYVIGSDLSQATTYSWPANAARSDGREINVHRAVLQGTIANTIAEHAHSLDANFVLMTSRRYGRWNSWRTSVTEEVMRLSRRPVCVTSAAATDPDFRLRNHRILCVVELDGREKLLVQHAEDMSARTGAELILLHVVPEPSEALLYHAIDGGSRPLSRERAARDIAELARTWRVPALTSVMVGDPRKCIALAAQEHSADVILVSRSRAGLPAAYDIEIERIVRTLHCPVLTVPVCAPVQRLDENHLCAVPAWKVGSAVSARHTPV